MKHPVLCLLLTLSTPFSTVSSPVTAVTHLTPGKVPVTPVAAPETRDHNCYKENAELSESCYCLILSLHLTIPPESLHLIFPWQRPFLFFTQKQVRLILDEQTGVDGHLRDSAVTHDASC